MLPPPQFFRRELRRAAFGQGDVDQRGDKRRVFGWVEADEAERPLEVGETLVRGGRRAAEPLAAPFGERVQRRVLQQLRRRPLDEGGRGSAEPRTELLDEPRLADAGLADDERELALALPGALPALAEEIELPLATHEPSRRPRARRPTPARAHDPVEPDG